MPTKKPPSIAQRGLVWLALRVPRIGTDRQMGRFSHDFYFCQVIRTARVRKGGRKVPASKKSLNTMFALLRGGEKTLVYVDPRGRVRRIRTISVE